jgi:hypothetical protein
MSLPFHPCSVGGCEGNAHRAAEGKRGYCSKHYQRLRRHGDPTRVEKPSSPALDWLRAHVGHPTDECLRWPFHIGDDGYGRVHRRGDDQLTTASRAMCEMAHGAPPSPKHEAAHSCGRGDNACTNPRHLYWATSARNHADKIEHGTTNRGERQWRSKLTAADVHEIRRLRGSMTQTKIGARFNVHQSVISDIYRGKKWGWLP